MSKKGIAVRPLETVLSVRSTDKKLDSLEVGDGIKGAHCRGPCVCRSCGRLLRPNTLPEEIINAFRKVTVESSRPVSPDATG